MPRLLKIILLSLVLFIIIVAVVIFCYFFWGRAEESKNIVWGVDFSQSQTEYLGLDWKEAFLAIIDDLGAKNIKLHTNWSWVEGKRNDYFFDDIDWQIKQAEEKNVRIVYVLGLKTGRWPECHSPSWLGDLSDKKQKEELLEYVTKVVQRYKNSKAIVYWQVENEPLFPFGECPNWYYKDSEFLKEEVALVKSLDPKRQIIISDSGEQSAWTKAAEIGDIVGITMYRGAWAHITDDIGFNLNFVLLNSTTYARKAKLIKTVYGKKVICIELQAEPWTKKALKDSTVYEQLESMNLNTFKKNIQFAKETGLDRFYLWGVEWWYQMKTQHGRPEIWNEAKTLFK